MRNSAQVRTIVTIRRYRDIEAKSVVMDALSFTEHTRFKESSVTTQILLVKCTTKATWSFFT